MITREDYKLGVELRKKADSIFADDDLEKFIKQYLTYLCKIESLNLIRDYSITDITYTYDSIDVFINEYEYGCGFISFPVEYLWMNEIEWKEIELKKHEEKVAKEKKERRDRREREKRKLYDELRAEYENCEDSKGEN
jgi:hypothetical protein